MSKLNKLWCEKYRPRNVDDIIFKNEELKIKFAKMIKAGEFPNLLFGGIQGTGKSTLSNVLIDCCNINRADILRIKCSSEGGIETVRNRIEGFTLTMPLGKFKVVQLEEYQKLSSPAQESLKTIIEDCSDTCRFIITTNHPNKVIPPIKSRFQEYFFAAPEFEQVLVYAMTILDLEQIEFEEELLEKYVTTAYPDIRKVVQIIQQNSVDGKLVRSDDVSNNDDYKFKLLELLEKNKFEEARKLVCTTIQNDEIEDVYQFLYQTINKSPKFSKLADEKAGIVLIADRLFRHAFVAHPHINLDACFVDLDEYNG